jgi:mycothiol synthase
MRLRLRAPVPEDAPAVSAVLVAREMTDLGVRHHTPADLLDQWRASDLDLAADARVVESSDGTVVGYAVVRPAGALAVVHPEHEGRGIGARLLEWVQRGALERGHERHRQWVAAGNSRARELLVGAGYAVARSYLGMGCSLEGATAAARSVGDGLRVRSVDVDRDAARLYEVDAAIFSGNPSYVAESLREFREEHLEAHDFDAGLSRVVETGDGRIIGFLLARRELPEAIGYVDLLAVGPDHQGRGLGTMLLAEAFAAFAAAGMREAQLGVDSDNPRALRIYERAGMEVRFRYDVYERPAHAPSRWRSYRDVDAASDPDSLAGQLDGIAAVPFLAAEKQRSLELLELGIGGAVLDVGCGTGPELGRLALIVGPGGRVVGLDRSATLLGEARSHSADVLGGVELIQGDAGAMPFADGEFDACRADRTVQHLASPPGALAEMVRVTRARGRVVVTESRWGLVAPSLDQRVTDSILGLMATGAEQAGWVGYRLAAMFEDAGLSDVRSVTGDHTVGEPEDFFAFTHLRGLAADAARAGVLTEAEATAWLDRLTDLLERGEAFAMVLVLHVAGVKPA